MQKTNITKKKMRTPYEGMTNATLSKDEVDITIIQWMLSMTPTERLQTLNQNIRSILRLRNARTNS
ncbi:MAG: hypothetical protein ACUZ8E_03435 [Candidatus Anammoxibacter sp.]